ncbi:MAG TPA: glycosyltransferase family 9 protein [Thermodesulfovibrionales bacterium]|nr:glycosyltransferase family 9 protein [Thermodesulfovibrionales bacterium]
MNRIRLLKTIDRTIGRSFVSLLSAIERKQNKVSDKLSKILIIRPGGIGDAVLLIPAINFLRQKFPEATIDILCEKRNADIFSLSRDVHKAYLYDKGLDLFRCLSNKYDVVIDTEQWHRLSAVLTSLTKAPVRIGFDTNERHKLFTHRVSYSQDDYEVVSFFRLLEPLGANPEPGCGNPPFINIRGEGFSPPSALTREDRLVAIFPGASVRERKWGGDQFGVVAKALSDIGYHVVLLGSSADKADAELIKKKAPSVTDLAGKTDLRQVATVLGMSSLLISADSGLLHVAYAVGIPTVSLFGSGIEKKWAPRGRKHIVINKHLDCSPCTRFGYTPKCKRNVECLASIHVDEVIEAARTILDAP